MVFAKYRSNFKSRQMLRRRFFCLIRVSYFICVLLTPSHFHIESKNVKSISSQMCFVAHIYWVNHKMYEKRAHFSLRSTCTTKPKNRLFQAWKQLTSFLYSLETLWIVKCHHKRCFNTHNMHTKIVKYSMTSKSWITHDRFFRKPCWHVAYKSLSVMWSTIASLTKDSRILQVMHVKLTGL